MRIRTWAMPLALAGASGALLLGAWALGGGGLAAFAAEPARPLLLAVTMAMFLAGPLAARRIGDINAKGGKHLKRQDGMIFLSMGLSLALGVASPLSDAAGVGTLPGGAALRWCGLGLYALGGMLMIWAPMYLGRYFSTRVTIQENHRLVTDGPFALMRHPRYAGCLYWGLGLPLVFLSLPGLAAAVLYGLTFVWRIRDEERLLAAHFGPQWAAYAARTRRVVPFVF
jgi:protein-S-isoprenylcysteine O-methyltransferase Ste14